MAPSKVVSGNNFGQRLIELREAHRWSRPDLTRRSGIPTPTIANYETGKVRKPDRGNIVALAQAVDWPDGVDAALSLVGERPLSADELRFLPAPVDLMVDVTRIWPQLAPRLQAAVHELLSAICEPHGAVGPDPTSRSRSRVISTPRDPVRGDGPPMDQSRCEYR